MSNALHGWSLMLFTSVALAVSGTGCSAAPDDPDSDELVGAPEDVATTEDGLSGSIAVGTKLTSTANVNLRTGASTDHKILHVVPNGATVTVVASTPKNGFYKIKHAGTIGWSFGEYYKKSSNTYRLPFSCGTKRTCSNGNHTSSHTGKDAFAYDFAMPVGTTVRAFRGGKVLAVRYVTKPGDSCFNGGGAPCANLANTVEVLHSNGTVGLYMHLSKPSVSKGQVLSRGSVIGKSGQTGWATGPHLHVQVQQKCGIWWCQSKKFSFGEKSSISAGTTVESKNCP